jgi:hypothetical protein
MPDLHHEFGADDEGPHLGDCGQSARPACGPVLGECVVLGDMRKDKLIRRLDGIGCNPAVIIGTREDLMKRMGRARSMNLLPFPEKNGPVVWPQYTIRDALALDEKHEECSGSVSG